MPVLPVRHLEWHAAEYGECEMPPTGKAIEPATAGAPLSVEQPKPARKGKGVTRGG